jgi:hypothetical protein
MRDASSRMAARRAESSNRFRTIAGEKFVGILTVEPA